MSNPTHAIATGPFGVPARMLLHYWGTEDEMLEMLTDPNSERFPMPRQEAPYNGSWINFDPERGGYHIVEISQADIDAEIAQRDQDQADQRAHSWAM